MEDSEVHLVEISFTPAFVRLERLTDARIEALKKKVRQESRHHHNHHKDHRKREKSSGDERRGEKHHKHHHHRRDKSSEDGGKSEKHHRDCHQTDKWSEDEGEMEKRHKFHHKRERSSGDERKSYKHHHKDDHKREKSSSDERRHEKHYKRKKEKRSRSIDGESEKVKRVKGVVEIDDSDEETLQEQESVSDIFRSEDGSISLNSSGNSAKSSRQQIIESSDENEDENDLVKKKQKIDIEKGENDDDQETGDNDGNNVNIKNDSVDPVDPMDQITDMNHASDTEEKKEAKQDSNSGLSKEEVEEKIRKQKLERKLRKQKLLKLAHSADLIKKKTKTDESQQSKPSENWLGKAKLEGQTADSLEKKLQLYLKMEANQRKQVEEINRKFAISGGLPKLAKIKKKIFGNDNPSKSDLLNTPLKLNTEPISETRSESRSERRGPSTPPGDWAHQSPANWREKVKGKEESYNRFHFDMPLRHDQEGFGQGRGRGGKFHRFQDRRRSSVCSPSQSGDDVDHFGGDEHDDDSDGEVMSDHKSPKTGERLRNSSEQFPRKNWQERKQNRDFGDNRSRHRQRFEDRHNKRHSESSELSDSRSQKCEGEPHNERFTSPSKECEETEEGGSCQSSELQNLRIQQREEARKRRLSQAQGVHDFKFIKFGRGHARRESHDSSSNNNETDNNEGIKRKNENRSSKDGSTSKNIAREKNEGEYRSPGQGGRKDSRDSRQQLDRKDRLRLSRDATTSQNSREKVEPKVKKYVPDSPDEDEEENLAIKMRRIDNIIEKFDIGELKRKELRNILMNYILQNPALKAAKLGSLVKAVVALLNMGEYQDEESNPQHPQLAQLNSLQHHVQQTQQMNVLQYQQQKQQQQQQKQDAADVDLADIDMTDRLIEDLSLQQKLVMYGASSLTGRGSHDDDDDRSYLASRSQSAQGRNQVRDHGSRETVSNVWESLPQVLAGRDDVYHRRNDKNMTILSQKTRELSDALSAFSAAKQQAKGTDDIEEDSDIYETDSNASDNEESIAVNTEQHFAHERTEYHTVEIQIKEQLENENIKGQIEHENIGTRIENENVEVHIVNEDKAEEICAEFDQEMELLDSIEGTESVDLACEIKEHEITPPPNESKAHHQSNTGSSQDPESRNICSKNPPQTSFHSTPERGKKIVVNRHEVNKQNKYDSERRVPNLMHQQHNKPLTYRDSYERHIGPSNRDSYKGHIGSSDRDSHIGHIRSSNRDSYEGHIRSSNTDSYKGHSGPSSSLGFNDEYTSKRQDHERFSESRNWRIRNSYTDRNDFSSDDNNRQWSRQASQPGQVRSLFPQQFGTTKRHQSRRF